MSNVHEATKPFRHTWKSLPNTCANFRCVTDDWHDLSKRKTYLECDAQDLNGNWKKSRFYLDENVKASTDGMIYLTTPNYRPNTLSSNLVSPHPKVAMRNGKIELTAHGQGRNGPVWRTVTLHDLMNEDNVVFSSGAGLSPKGLAVRLAWIEGDKAKTESDKVKKAAERKELQPYFREEWLALHSQEIKRLEEMRHLFSGDRSSYIDDRIKEVEGLMANVPEVPDGWSSEKLQQAREKEEKVKREAKEEAERKELEASWKKWWQ
ncbi:hypothetical protein N7475_007805, partial [Penicillium sp. IBT 31633x]